MEALSSFLDAFFRFLSDGISFALRSLQKDLKEEAKCLFLCAETKWKEFYTANLKV